MVATAGKPLCPTGASATPMAAAPSARRFPSDSPALPAEEPALARRFEEAERNLAWLDRNYEVVRRRAAGRFVVVFRQKVVASGKSVEAARRKAKAALKVERLQDALVQYIPTKDEAFVW